MVVHVGRWGDSWVLAEVTLVCVCNQASALVFLVGKFSPVKSLLGARNVKFKAFWLPSSMETP